MVRCPPLLIHLPEDCGLCFRPPTWHRPGRRLARARRSPMRCTTGSLARDDGTASASRSHLAASAKPAASWIIPPSETAAARSGAWRCFIDIITKAQAGPPA